MNKTMKHYLSPILLASLLLGCTEKEAPASSPAEDAEAIEVVPSEVDLQDIEAEAKLEAESKIDESNADDTLEALEVELDTNE
jgi:PBP1b-binding outer membrane lipoprotein LpoB